MRHFSPTVHKTRLTTLNNSFKILSLKKDLTILCLITPIIYLTKTSPSWHALPPFSRTTESPDSTIAKLRDPHSQQCYYETAPSQEPIQQCSSIELQTLNTHNLQTNRNNQMQKKNNEN